MIPGEARFRDLDPRVRRLFVGFAFSALGSGLTVPFLYVYLAQVRGLPDHARSASCSPGWACSASSPPRSAAP